MKTTVEVPLRAPEPASFSSRARRARRHRRALRLRRWLGYFAWIVATAVMLLMILSFARALGS